MSVLFYDGFDHYETADFLAKWDYTQFSPSISTSGGRNGGGCWYGNSSSAASDKNLPGNYATLIVGCACKFGAFTTNPFLQLMDGSTTQVSVRLETSGKLSVMLGTSTIIETSTDNISLNTWYYIELKVTIDNSSGSYELKVGETTWCADTGVDTQVSANAYVNEIRLWNQANNGQTYVDDLYVLDTSGDTNDFIGDVTAKSLYVNSSGTYAQWQVTGSASNYLAIDDQYPDDDSTYTYATGSSLKDSFSLGDLGVGDGIIYGIQVLLYTRKDEAGAVLLDPTARINGTDYTLGTGSFSISDSYKYYRSIEETNPDTSGSWTLSDIDNMEIGYTRSG